VPNLSDPSTLLGLSVALGIGLLIGAERERRKGSGPTRGAAGIRTFAVASLLGAVAVLLGGELVLAVVATVQPALLGPLMWPLVLGGVAACAYSLLFFPQKTPALEAVHAQPQKQDMGRAFDLRTALAFAAIVSVVLVVSAALNAWLGERGTLLAAAVTGLVDAHATAASVASLAAAGKLPMEAALWPILAGLSTNSLMKAVVAFHAGGVAYAARIVPGLVLVIAAIWLGAWLG